MAKRLKDFDLYTINYGKANHEQFRKSLVEAGYGFAQWDDMKEEMQVAFIEAAESVMDVFARATLA